MLQSRFRYAAVLTFTDGEKGLAEETMRFTHKEAQKAAENRYPNVPGPVIASFRIGKFRITEVRQ